MADLEGGYRDRVIAESFARLIKDSLTALGWFAPTDRHTPIIFRTSPVPDGQTIPFNTLVVDTEDISGNDLEIGSGLTEDRHMVNIDFYGEKRGLAKHLIGDIRDICRGKMPSIDRTDPTFEVRNWDGDGATVLFWCDIEDVQMETAHGGSQPHEANWMAVSALLVEERP